MESKAKESKSKDKKHKSNVSKAKKAHAKKAAECNTHAAHAAKSGKKVNVHRNAVKKAIEEAKTTCKREKKRRAAAKERKAKLEAHGPTFNSKPCKGGKGSFVRKMKQNARAVVGKIPPNMHNVLIKLRTDKDVDAELWTHNGKREIAIVAWQVGKINSPTKAEIQYAGGKIEYSGYNGITTKKGMNFGHEDIGIKGQCKVGFTMKAYAFQAGVAKINYSWGVNKEKCAAAKAKVRKEKKAKHDAKNAMKKKMKEGQYKAALKVLVGGKGCAGANNWTKKAQAELSKALKKHASHKASMAKCHKEKKQHAKHVAAMKSAEKRFKKDNKKA